MHGAPVDHVDFFVEGRKRWTEKNPPYFFNDDEQFLSPGYSVPGSMCSQREPRRRRVRRQQRRTTCRWDVHPSHLENSPAPSLGP